MLRCCCCAQASNSTAAEPSSVECFTAEHWPYAVPGIILLVVFVVLSARLMSVGGELASIEMTANPLNWRGDSRKVQKAYVHALSAHSTAHASVTVAVKTVAVFATTFMGTKHPVIVAAVRAYLSMSFLHASASQLNHTALSDLVRRCWSGAGW